MLWYLVFMMMGAIVFALGIAFERFKEKPAGQDNKDLPETVQTDIKLSRQWQNLLEYDGNEQEEDYEDR